MDLYGPDFSDSRDPILSNSRDPMIIFSDSRDTIFNYRDPNRVPKTPWKKPALYYTQNYTQYQILNVASAREWDFTVQTVWWYCAVAHLRGDIGPHITSSDRGERGFQNDDGVKNRYLKFWWPNMWTRPNNNRCYSATVQNSFQKSLILRSLSAMNSCSIAMRSTWSINCLWMCKNILWFKGVLFSLFVN